MIHPTDIYTLDSFRRRPGEHVRRLQSTGRPEVLTVNGKPSVVVQDAAAYEAQLERLEVLEALAESVKQADAGQAVALRALREELGVK